MYEVQFDEGAIEFLEKVPVQIKERIFSKIMQAKENPYHFFVRLTGRLEYKLRVGDYRVIADIQDNIQVVQILFIGHRRNIYKKI